MKPKTSNRMGGVGRLAAGAWAIATFASVSSGQVWNVSGATCGINGQAFADDFVATPPGVFDQDFCAVGGAMIPGLLGFDFAQQCGQAAKEKKFTPPQSAVIANIFSRTTVAGNGASLIEICWVNHTLCDAAAIDGFSANANQRLDSSIALSIGGLPAGTPVTVHYSWDAYGAAHTEHEAVFDDPVATLDGKLVLDGGDLLGGAFNFQDPPGPSGFNQLLNQNGSFMTVAGATHFIDISSDQRSRIEMPGEGLYNGQDASSTVFRGCLRLSLTGPVPPGPGGGGLGNAVAEFSVDIGGDTEHTDANLDGNGVFDPGDLYPWFGPALPPCGADGRDDAFIFFGTDPFPDPPNCIPQATGAPVCSGLPPFDPLLLQWFDLDGHDNTSFDIRQFQYGPGQGGIPRFNAPCVFEPAHIFVSLDDDEAEHYVGVAGSCQIPVFSPSPALGRRYGRTATRDEVIGVETLGTVGTPVLLQYPVLDEESLHVSLAPNPDLSDLEDDDVDSLDILEDPAACDRWYFSADHEATHVNVVSGAVLNPGSIYLVTPGGPVEVISAQFHLGLAQGVDVDGFEFAWLPAPNGDVLALLFSVDDDDPLTPVDESGGLDSRMIYASVLNGISVDYLNAPLRDDIDAITIWQNDLINFGSPCVQAGDVNGDFIVDLSDVIPVIMDMDVPGSSGFPTDRDGVPGTDFNDLDVVLSAIGGPSSLFHVHDIDLGGAPAHFGAAIKNPSGASFYQDPAGSDYPPMPADIAVFPNLEFDSYVALGGSPSTILTLAGVPEGSTIPFGAPPGHFPVSNEVHGGWFESGAAASQLNVITGKQSVFLARLTVPQGDSLCGFRIRALLEFCPDARTVSLRLDGPAAKVDDFGNALAVPVAARARLRGTVNILGFGPADIFDLYIEESNACEGDVDGNGTVNVNDISFVVFRLGDTCGPGDADGDGVVNVNDITYVVFRLGPC